MAAVLWVVKEAGVKKGKIGEKRTMLEKKN